MTSSGGQPVKSAQKRNHSNHSNESAFDCQTMHSRRTYTINSLWSVWYCAIVMAFQAYIIANSIDRFTVYLSLPWPNGQPPFTALNSYVVLIGAGVVILPFFVVVAMMKVGNYANDGHKFGQRVAPSVHTSNIYENVRMPQMPATEQKRRRRLHVCRLVWKHSAPVSSFLHLLASLCFLIPRVLMEAQLIKHSFLGKGDIWKTELDFLLNRFEDKRISLFGFLNTINDTERSLLNMESYSINQYLSKHSNQMKQQDYHLEESGHLSMELINFGVALFVLSVRYPSVFWRVNKGFGFIFSLQLVINLIQSLLIYSAFQVALKVIVCNPSHVLVRFQSHVRLNVLQISLVFVVYIILLTLSGTSVYMYGLHKYREWYASQTRKLHITAWHTKRLFWGYFSHLFAFFTLIVLALSISPLFYDLIVIYCGSLDSAALIAIISTAFHLLLWIILWIMFTLKSKWHFVVNFECDNCNATYNSCKVERKLLPYKRGDAPLLVIESGHTYQIRELASKRAILGVARKSRPSHKPISPNEDEDIYWLKPKSSPNKVLGKESPEDENALTWLKNDKKANGNKNKVSFDDGNSTTDSKGKKKCSKKSPKNTLKTKKNKGSQNDIDFDEISDHSDGEYATLRRIANSDFNDSNLTHLNLCPLRNERIETPKSHLSPMDGDYELLVEHIYSPDLTCNANLIYGNQVKNMTSTPISVAAHFSKDEQMLNNDQLTPRSASISETSTSPEKASDTSSGVHSNSSNGANCTPPLSVVEKRSTSMENIMQQIQAAAAAKPSFRSLSLQRYMSSLPQDYNHRMAHFVHQNARTNGLMDDMMADTMVIRRDRRPQRTSQSFNSSSLADNVKPQFERETNVRMTSFADSADYFKYNSVNSDKPSRDIIKNYNSLPCSPKLIANPPNRTQLPAADYGNFGQIVNNSNIYEANQRDVSLAPLNHLPVQNSGINAAMNSTSEQVISINANFNFCDQSLPNESANYLPVSSQYVSEIYKT